MENHHVWWKNSLEMAMLNSYLSHYYKGCVSCKNQVSCYLRMCIPVVRCSSWPLAASRLHAIWRFSSWRIPKTRRFNTKTDMIKFWIIIGGYETSKYIWTVFTIRDGLPLYWLVQNGFPESKIIHINDRFLSSSDILRMITDAHNPQGSCMLLDWWSSLMAFA